MDLKLPSVVPRTGLDIDVDPATGRWYVDSLPMILVPQHFFLNNHFAVEQALGAEKLAEILRPAGFKSAYHWCEKEAAHHGLAGVDIFHHYMKRLSQRGWAQFRVLALDPDQGRGTIRVDHSAFVTGDGPRGRKVCAMFAAWFEGSLAYVAASRGSPRETVAREVYCAAEGEHDHCRFEIAPAHSE